eukprot:17290-Heterococcus_DN1.PRE.5
MQQQQQPGQPPLLNPAWLAVLYSDSLYVQQQQVSRSKLLLAKNSKHKLSTDAEALSGVVDSSLRALPILSRRSLRRSGRAFKNSFKLQSQLDNGQLIPNITDLASSAALATNSTLLRAVVQAIDSTSMEDDSTPTLLWARASESLRTALQSRAEADVALAAARALSVQQQLTTRYNSVRSEMTAFTDALLDAKH